MSHALPIPRRRQHGRTLLELMIAIAIGLVILLALGTVYVGTTRTNRQAGSVSRMSEDAAIAFSVMGGSLRMAGYSTPRALVLPGGALIGGVKRVAPDRNFTGAAVRGCDHGFVNAAATFDTLACQTADTTQPAAVAVRFEGDAFNTVPITVGGIVNPSDCLNQAVLAANATPSAVDPALTFRLIESRFTAKVGGSGTPELYCGGNGGNITPPTFTPQPLMQFVDSVQLRYGVASDGTSRDVTHYASSDEVDALAGTLEDKWSRVVNLRVCVVMRSQGADQAGAGNYIDCDGNSVASPDSHARRSFTAFYALRNRSGFLKP